MRGHPEHNTRQHARLTVRFLGKDAWMTSQLNVALIRKLRGSLIYLAFLDGIHENLYNRALTDVRSTGEGIRHLYCIQNSQVSDYTERGLFSYIDHCPDHWGVLGQYLRDNIQLDNIPPDNIPLDKIPTCQYLPEQYPSLIKHSKTTSKTDKTI